MSALVTATGARWAVEEASQIDKGQAGPDHYQCRTRIADTPSWPWAVLAAFAAAQPPPRPDPPD